MLKKSYETEISDIGSIDILTQNRPIELIPCKSDKLKITYAVRKRNQVLPEFTKTDNGDGKKAFQMEYRDQEELWRLVRFTFLPFIRMKQSVSIYQIPT